MPAALGSQLAEAQAAPSTFIVPEAIAGSATSHIPSTMAGRRSCRDRLGRAGIALAWREAGEQRDRHGQGRGHDDDCAENTGPRPRPWASVPTTGPNSAPPIPAASAPPIALPRRSSGVSTISQTMLPAHVHAPPTPWMKRAASSSATLSRSPKARLEPPIRREAGVERDARPGPLGEHAARNRSDQRPDRVAGGQDARGRLGQVELAGEGREQRHDRGVEHRVDEHDRAGDHEQQPELALVHARGGSGRDTISRRARRAGAPRTPRARRGCASSSGGCS